jgi:hypothetical protein
MIPKLVPPLAHLDVLRLIATKQQVHSGILTSPHFSVRTLAFTILRSYTLLYAMMQGRRVHVSMISMTRTRGSYYITAYNKTGAFMSGCVCELLYVYSI